MSQKPSHESSRDPIDPASRHSFFIELKSDRELAGEPLPPLVELIPCGPPPLTDETTTVSVN
jgi:hypothetical protein